jgi:hypothetical protein
VPVEDVGIFPYLPSVYVFALFNALFALVVASVAAAATAASLAPSTYAVLGIAANAEDVKTDKIVNKTAAFIVFFPLYAVIISKIVIFGQQANIYICDIFSRIIQSVLFPKLLRQLHQLLMAKSICLQWRLHVLGKNTVMLQLSQSDPCGILQIQPKIKILDTR